MNEKIATNTVNSITETDYIKSCIQYLADNEIVITPLLLLLIIYVIKYFLGTNFEKKALVEFFLEFPVDYAFLGISLIMTYFFLDIEFINIGKIMVLICICIALLNTVLRRLALKEYYKENCNNIYLGLYGIFNASVSVLFVYFILNVIKLSSI